MRGICARLPPHPASSSLPSRPLLRLDPRLVLTLFQGLLLGLLLPLQALEQRVCTSCQRLCENAEKPAV